MRKHYLRAMLLARDRISDGLGADVNNSSDRKASLALLLVKLKLNRFKYWLVKDLGHGCNDIENRCEWLGFLPTQNLQQCFSLLLIGALIDDRQCLAMALMDRTRPSKDCGSLDAVQPDIAEMALIDSQGDDCAAITSREYGIELTGASPVTIAGGELGPLDHPVDVGHGNFSP